MDLRSSNPFWLNRLVFTSFLVFFLGSFIIFTGLNKVAFYNNYAYSELLFLGEKALLVFYGKPPRLENLGFVYPPLPYLFVLIFRDSFISASFVGAFSISLFVIFMAKALTEKTITYAIALSTISFLFFCFPVYLVTKSNLLSYPVFAFSHLLPSL